MPRSSADIVELALAKIGVFSTYDTGADASQFARALDFFDTLLSEKVGTEILWWFVPTTQVIPLTLGVGAYGLNALTATDLQYIHRVFISDESGDDTYRPLELIRKPAFDLGRDQIAEVGRVERCYVERNETPNLYLLRAPAIAGMSLRIEGQTYSPNVKNDHGETPHGFPEAWERYLYHILARDIGSGPVTTLPKSELDDIDKQATIAKRLLDARNTRENVDKSKARATKPYL
jgi:hypothetical protein